MDALRKDASFLKLGRKIRSIFLICAILAAFFGIPARSLQSASPTIQSYILQGNDLDRLSQAVHAAGGRITSRLPLIHALGASLSGQAAMRLQADPAVTSVFPNGSFQVANSGVGVGAGKPNNDFSGEVGAQAAWAGGVSGANVSVAVLDTGISNLDTFRPRLAGWVDFVDSYPRPVDPNGHGTHVAGIIAGGSTGLDGAWSGIAPAAGLVGVRVLDASGYGTYEQVIGGIQWVVEHKDQYNIRVMNLSLVSPARSPYWADPLNQAVMQAWAVGITVVAAAGNGGPAPLTVGVPGNNPYVITVGAFSDHFTPNDSSDDTLAAFSAAGPTLDGFVKPDVVAPGAHIVSTMLPSASLSRSHAANRIDSQYFSMAGTSQATAVVSGIAALVLSADPTLTPDQVKYRILSEATPWLGQAPYSIWQVGHGRANAAQAIASSSLDSANAGLDVQADLTGSAHFQGYAYFDATSDQYRLPDSMDHPEWTSSGGMGSWSGGMGSWSGGMGSWSGGMGSWSGGLGSWSGSLSADPVSLTPGKSSAGKVSPLNSLPANPPVTIDRWVEEP